MAAPIEAAFALAVDADRFPGLFAGCGPVPGLRRVRLQGALTVGVIREVESEDGSHLLERVTVLEPPYRHAYTLSGMKPPFSWLVRAGRAEWTFRAADSGTLVRWCYEWEPTTRLAHPAAWLLLKLFMRGAMRRCLRAMAATLQSQESAA